MATVVFDVHNKVKESPDRPLLTLRLKLANLSASATYASECGDARRFREIY